MSMNQMTKERREAYVEVLEILKHMDKSDVAKVPSELREFFEIYASKEYKFHIDVSIPLEKHILKENTINILAMLNLNYWCKSEEHKQELLRKYHENDLKFQEEIDKRYSTEKLFKIKNEIKDLSYEQKEYVSDFPLQYVEEKWYEKVYGTILKFIKKYLRKNYKNSFFFNIL